MEFVSIAQSVYDWLATVLFGEVLQNNWYTANRDIIIGISILIVCALVFGLAVWIVISALRFLGRLIDVRW